VETSKATFQYLVTGSKKNGLPRNTHAMNGSRISIISTCSHTLNEKKRGQQLDSEKTGDSMPMPEGASGDGRGPKVK